MRIFDDETDYRIFLALLRNAALDVSFEIHAFALMRTHFHLLATPATAEALMQIKRIDECYAMYFNQKYERTGPVWTGRFHSLPIDSDAYCLSCLRYIEQNPVAAGIVTSPDEYEWSSYTAHAHGRWPDWLTPHRTYLALGSTDADRQCRYRELCGIPVASEEIKPASVINYARYLSAPTR
jgi:putative transposase